MAAPMRWRHLAMAAPVALAFVAAGCAGGSSPPVAAAPQATHLNIVRSYDQGTDSPRDVPVPYITVNVDITDEGMEPRALSIPAGQQVQIVMRNRGAAEHHYQVLGLKATDIARRLPDAETAEGNGMDAEDHSAHHGQDAELALLLPLSACASKAGVCPRASEVHAFADGGGVDAVLFTATRTGTYTVQCPLHPKISGKLVVS